MPHKNPQNQREKVRRAWEIFKQSSALNSLPEDLSPTNKVPYHWQVATCGHPPFYASAAEITTQGQVYPRCFWCCPPNKLPPKNSLSDLLQRQFVEDDPFNNDWDGRPIKAEMIQSKCASRQFRWKHTADPNHQQGGCGYIWENTPWLRTMRGHGCPACGGNAVGPENNLDAWVNQNLTLRQKLLNEWHPTKNLPLTPITIARSSSRLVWWTCPKTLDCGETYPMPLSSRTVSDHDCPFCRGLRIGSRNNLAVRRPDIAAFWDAECNKKLRPTDVTVSSGQEVWWRCPKHPEHTWPKIVAQQVNYPGCAWAGCELSSNGSNGKYVHHASSLQALFPELAMEYSPKNVLPCSNILPGSNASVIWVCRIRRGSDEECGHEWSAAVCDRTRFDGGATGCPACSGRIATSDNNLRKSIESDPMLMGMNLITWFERASNHTKLEHLTPSSHTEVEWICDHGHRFSRSPHVAIRGIGCPECELRLISDTELAILAELKHLLGENEAVDGPTLSNPTGKSKMIKTDILLPGPNVILEYDGVYFHKDKVEKDRRRNKHLSSLGFHVMRIREVGLPLLGDLDVQVRSIESSWTLQRWSRYIHRCVSATLTTLIEKFPGKVPVTPKIKDYLANIDGQMVALDIFRRMKEDLPEELFRRPGRRSDRDGRSVEDCFHGWTYFDA